ncbi:DNA mismatch repair protein MutS [Antarcticibacterium sp. 1MA-6-2]|uniref:MutS-related protein n=1 Tax=Antarcticibacterium sp. 1MA-6-2 TaxID=2908210 RepID=UPI001F16F61E|nr:DNA mismatch repair protein MutS [Antarcticibacterium sp. 1MA-6-2]UJH89912.1 DNA mismatch repair protein MutS [Antarcticibacterium sp. 1MA-6-2]
MTANNFYTSEKDLQEQHLQKANRQLNIASTLRLLVFLLVAYGIYYFFGETRIVALIAFVGIGIFLFLVSRHTDLKYERDKIQELVKLNELELRVLGRDFHDLPTGKEYEDPLHPYSQDIDLFGKGSFFQYLNRTALKEGTDRLADLLTENSIDEILEKQEAIKELSSMGKWRQEFTAVAKLVRTETNSRQVLRWFLTYKPFVPQMMKWVPIVFSIISLLVITGYIIGFVTGMQLFLWFLVGLMITGIFIKKVNLLSESVNKVQDTFHQYHQLLDLLENTKFSSEVLLEKIRPITEVEGKASKIFKKFSRSIDSLEQRNNFLLGVFLNGFLLWDLQQSYRLEKWIVKNRHHVENWFEVIEFFDAYNSLGNFAFNHQDYTYPVLVHEVHTVKAKDLAHPLLDPKKRIANDFEIKKENFFIITGANMAGKSTFLRTVSLQIVMANMGLPVCASSCDYSPIKLITSMRTTDSLSDDESYFFSELKRLQYIVGEIKTDKYFIILDEILKGTNSTDKAIGSRKFIQKLVGSQSTGIIATHDLSLCEVAEELPQVKNYYFDAEIINDELNFDYRFKNGVCQNMNASFLLKKMQIVD